MVTDEEGGFMVVVVVVVVGAAVALALLLLLVAAATLTGAEETGHPGGTAAEIAVVEGPVPGAPAAAEAASANAEADSVPWGCSNAVTCLWVISSICERDIFGCCCCSC